MGLDTEKEMNLSTQIPSGFSIDEYESSSALTDKLSDGTLIPVSLGLFGEVGSLMATSKKYHREGEAYAAYKEAVIDEFGDTLWYLAAICRRLGYRLQDIISDASEDDDVSTALVLGHLPNAPITCIRSFTDHLEFDELLIRLGQQAATLLRRSKDNSIQRSQLVTFTHTYLRTVQSCNIPLSLIAITNLTKTRGRFLEREPSELPNFDSDFPEEERLPNVFRIEIGQRENGKCYLRWNGVLLVAP